MSLDTGGAEESLRKLTLATQADFAHSVISLGARSHLSELIAKEGSQVVSLDVKRRGPIALWDAWRLLRRQSPDVLQGWMYYGNLIAVLLRPLSARRSKLVWNIRHSPHDLGAEKRSIRWAISLAKHCNPDLVIYNSFDGKAVHARIGFARFASVVIPNGVDTERFKPRQDVRLRLRGSSASDACAAKWVALVARFHPNKGVDHFLNAVSRLRSKGLDFKVILAGPGMDSSNQELTAMIKHVGLQQGDIDCRGSVEDPSVFLPALDLVVIASVSEGMPNVLLEAMACGVATVATKVGDVEKILTEPKRLANPGDAGDLADKIAYALSAAPTDDRAYVEQHFGLDRCNAAYCETYVGLLA